VFPARAAWQEIRGSRQPLRGFLSKKTTPRCSYQTTVIAKML
jgi:hypothetical protein